jgi:autotransporter-associated beta strand protein
MMAVMLVSSHASAQTTYSWANVGSDWGIAANWSPSSGFPGSALNDISEFIPRPFGPAFANPFVGSPFAFQTLNIANSPSYGNYTFTGLGSLTLSSAAAGGVIGTRGIGTTTFNGPTLAGATATNNLLFNVGTSTMLVLTGSSAVTANGGNVTVNGGTLRLDNSGGFVSRLANTGTVIVNGSGALELIGSPIGASTQNVGNLSAGSNVIGGVNVFRITPNGNNTVLNFANTGTFSSRPGTRGVYHFIATQGNLGDASGAQMTFVGTPFLGANGLLANTAGGGTVGFAIVTDAGGTDFASWNATNGIIRAVPTVVTPDLTAPVTASDRVQFNPSGSVTPAGTITVGSLRITPTTAGTSLNMGTNALATNALMLDGPNSFTISGTGNLGATGTRYVHVNDANSTLDTSIVVANGGNPTTFPGPGVVNLTGNASQNTLTGTNRFVIGGGVVRGNNTQIGFTSAGAGIISFGGGVLEINNGSNGTGAAADFTRALGAAAGNVTWGAGSGNELGSGGFSAFGAPASVNIGGAATPASLQWGQTNFIGDGYALIFGSSKSNAQLNWLNPLQLDNGTGYQAREIRVNQGVGGDLTSLRGAITGTANADLIKTGNGTLELAATNTYQGNTIIRAGRILANDPISSTGTGNVLVMNGGTIGGTGTIASAGILAVQSGGTIAPGNSIGTLTAANPVAMDTGSRFAWELNNPAPVAAPANSGGSNSPGLQDQLAITGSGNTLVAGNITFAVSESMVPPTFVIGNTYSWTVVTAQAPAVLGTVTFNLADAPTFAAFGGPSVMSLVASGNNVYLNFTPVPEPASILTVCAAAGWVGGIVVRRRMKKKQG